jgi:EAL domain-containing protein (putative c-di-GMP-specific phosphodiesterase class I)
VAPHFAPESLTGAATSLGAPRPSYAPVANFEGAFRQALAARHLQLQYQPIIRLRDGRVAALEGLLRWSRDGSLLHAADFVPMAEKLGLAHDLTRAVLDRVSLDWRRGPFVKGELVVNVPLSVMLHAELPAILATQFRRSRSGSSGLLLELTETESIRDQGRLRHALMRLKRIGCHVLLDDVLLGDRRWRLRDMPFAGVKLDRSLTEALPGCMRARRFVREIIAHARRHGRYVVAEGVANEALRRAVRSLGVDFAQGFLLGHPAPPKRQRDGQSDISLSRRVGKAR